MRASLPLLAILSSLIAAGFASPVKRGISSDVYNDLVFYFQYASSAYDSTCAKPNGNTLVGQFSDSGTDTQGFVARDDSRKEIVVALRGSSDAVDFWTDAQVLLEDFTSPGTTPPAGTSAHTGFLNAWNSVAAQVISTVKSQLSSHSGYTIVTTGHSLGGALSSLAGITLKQNFPSSPIRMYTYGQPRTGNDNYAFWVNDQFGANAFRAVHTTDGVPTIIPTSVGYRHHGVEYWQNPDPPSASTTKECAADGEDPTCSASVPSQGIDLAHTIYFDILATTPFCS
ncbi:alpha/beta-hydrolase [Dentipellis sp. KUC8613]|nr:alpha/beta-hydrolase [Dentipellis sp. KUC8613]